MAPTEQPPDCTPIATLIERYLEATAKVNRTGNYRVTAQSALKRWASWLQGQGFDRVKDIDRGVMCSYAQELRRTVRDGDLAASTATTYYATVRACLNWAIEDGLLVENPAAATRATKELPEDTAEPSRQF